MAYTAGKSLQDIKLGRLKWKRHWLTSFIYFYVFLKGIFFFFAVNEALCMLKLNLIQASENQPPKSSTSSPLIANSACRRVHRHCRTSGGSLLLGSISRLSVPCSGFWGALQTRVDLGAGFCEALPSVVPVF